MRNPNPVNLQTSAEIRAAGWQAETRDADGHLCRAHVPFSSDEEIIWLVREALEHGETITIWPAAATIWPATASPRPSLIRVPNMMEQEQ